MTQKGTSGNLPRVSVVIPMRNEEQYIGRCLHSLIGQDYPKELIEIIVVDGGSADESIMIVQQLMEQHSNIKLLGGPGVNCPAAMNVGIRDATGELISKVDAHGYVAQDFLKKSAEYLSKDGKIKCVGGPIRPVAQTSIAKANTFARSSMFGVGKGAYSMRQSPQFVYTVQCGVYKRDIFGEIGLFDESLQFGEDEEINWRIIKMGYKIFSTPEIRFFYFPRNSFRELFRQYYNYGMARVKVIQKHPDFFSIKHVIPAMFILSLFASGILGIFSDLFLGFFGGVAVLYLAVSLAFSAVVTAKEGRKYLGLLPVSFAALHFGYGIGFWRGILELCFFCTREAMNVTGLKTGGREFYCQNVRLGVERFFRGVNYWRYIEYPWVLDKLSLSENQKILDVGSSSCSLLALLLASKRKYVVYATDIDDGVLRHLELARKLGLDDQIETRRFIAERQDATCLSYPDETFDRVMAVSVLEHFPHQEDHKAVKELSRVLRPGGLAVLTVPFSSRYKETFLDKSIYQRHYKGEPVFYQRHYDSLALKERLIGPSGLNVKMIEYFGERTVKFERIWYSLPVAIKAMFGWMMPLISTLFIREIDHTDLEKAMAAFFVLKKPA